MKKMQTWNKRNYILPDIEIYIDCVNKTYEPG